MNQQRVLVTGGAGYIGSHVCKALAGAGFTPVTYDNLCRGHEGAVRWGPEISRFRLRWGIASPPLDRRVGLRRTQALAVVREGGALRMTGRLTLDHAVEPHPPSILLRRTGDARAFSGHIDPFDRDDFASWLGALRMAM